MASTCMINPNLQTTGISCTGVPITSTRRKCERTYQQGVVLCEPERFQQSE